jgi:TonB family protein
MLRWFHLAAIGILAPALAGARQLTNPPPTTLAFDTGTIANGSYTNECLGFTYPIPDGSEVFSKFAGNMPNVKAKHVGESGLILLILDQNQGKPLKTRIVLSAAKANDSAADTKEFVSKFVRQQIKNAEERGENAELTRDAFLVNLAGNDFYREDFRSSSAVVTGYTSSLGVKFRGHFLVWTVVAPSTSELEESVNSLQRLLFQEDQENPKCVAGQDNISTLSPVIGGIVSAGPGHVEPGSLVRVSQGVMQGLLITKVQPGYPDLARVARIQGTVVLRALIDTNGNIEDLALLSGHPMLVAAASEAVKQWKYKPYILNGTPVKVETSITVNFQLADK